MDATLELVAAISTDLDAAGIELDVAKDDLRKLRHQNQILEARLQGVQEPPLLDDDGEEDHWASSPARKRVRYGDPGYRTRYL